MKWFIFLLALLAGTAHAGEATFTWTPPVPIWEPEPDGSQPVVPPNWTINEYRIKCTVVVSGQPDQTYTRVVADYDSTTVSYSDLPNGATSCHMTSYSEGAGTESRPSITVSKFVMDDVTPAPPTVFDFMPLVSMLGLPIPANQVIRSKSVINIAGNAYTIDCMVRLNHRGKLITSCAR